MYRPRQVRGRVRGPRRPDPGRYANALVTAATAIFWVSATVFLGLMVLYTATGDVGTASTWTTGLSLLLLAGSSGVITWMELRNNPLDDTERGEWTNKMLFYGLACVFSVIVASLYLPALYFAP